MKKNYLNNNYPGIHEVLGSWVSWTQLRMYIPHPNEALQVN